MRTLAHKPVQGICAGTKHESQLRVFRSSRDGPASGVPKDVSNSATLGPNYDPSSMGTLHPKP